MVFIVKSKETIIGEEQDAEIRIVLSRVLTLVIISTFDFNSNIIPILGEGKWSVNPPPSPFSWILHWRRSAEHFLPVSPAGGRAILSAELGGQTVYFTRALSTVPARVIVTDWRKYYSHQWEAMMRQRTRKAQKRKGGKKSSTPCSWSRLFIIEKDKNWA